MESDTTQVSSHMTGMSPWHKHTYRGGMVGVTVNINIGDILAKVLAQDAVQR